MARSNPLERVSMATATVGTGTITLGAALAAFANFDEAGAANGDQITYLIEDGNDFEIGIGTYTASGTTLSRDTVILSKISGSAGTTKITLSGDAIVSCVHSARDVDLESSIGKHTIWVPAYAMYAPATNGAAQAQVDPGSSHADYIVFDFDASADEYVIFWVAFPKSWDLGTVTFRAFWTTTATDTDGVAWAMMGKAHPDSSGLNVSSGTPVVVTDNALATAGDVHVTDESAAVTITTAGADSLTKLRVFRDVSDAADTMAEDARLLGIQLFYTTNAATDD